MGSCFCRSGRDLPGPGKYMHDNFGNVNLCCLNWDIEDYKIGKYKREIENSLR